MLTARTALSVALAWFSLSAGYSYLLTIAHYPETLRAHPERAPVFFGQLASARITEQGFNVTNAGWRVIAALYANGELRGESDSTAPEVQNWYLAKSWAPPRPAPRYFFVAQAQKPKYPERIVPADLEQTHDLWGTVIVNGEPQIKIYQRRNGSTLPKARNLRAEDYESAWAQLASLGRFEQLKGNQRDDSAFYMLGQVLQTDGRPGDAIILDNPLVQTILNLYYRGDLPYLDLRQQESPAAYQRIWGIFRGSGGGATERALAESAYPASSQWIGNIHVRLYGVVPDGPLREAMSNLGEVASLLRSSTLPSTLHAGQLLPVRLIWQARQATEIRYKVFVHVTDSRGLLVAQADDEPQAGLRPTDGWQAGEIINDRIGVWLPLPIPPGRYQVTIGLYDPASGARLAAVSQDGARTAEDAVPLGDLLVVGE